MSLERFWFFNSLTGIIFIWTALAAAKATIRGVLLFNSLTGIIFIWTVVPLKPYRTRAWESICENLPG